MLLQINSFSLKQFLKLNSVIIDRQEHKNRNNNVNDINVNIRIPFMLECRESYVHGFGYSYIDIYNNLPKRISKDDYASFLLLKSIK